MKYLILPLLALSFLAGSQNLDARCRQPEQGPPGPLLTNYIGLNSPFFENPQPLAPFDPTLVVFPFITAGPAGITPGGSSNYTDFTVDEDGVYLICWAVNAGTDAGEISDDEAIPPGTPPFLQLDLLINGSPAALSPVQSFQSFYPSNGGESYINASGQIKLELSAGDVIQLEATALYDGESYFILLSSLFNVVRVADLP